MCSAPDGCMPDKIRIPRNVTSIGARFKRFACIAMERVCRESGFIAQFRSGRLACHVSFPSVLSLLINMKMLLFTALIAVGVFGLAFYQSYRDKRRWKRLARGRNPFRKGELREIPPLTLDGLRFDSVTRPVLVIWGNLKQTGFLTVADARAQLERERLAGSSKANDARIFAWDGESWKQRSSPAR